MTSDADRSAVVTSGRNAESDATHNDVDVSVIIPCLNRSDVIAEDLDALAQQERERGWEVLVADNGSTDGLHAVIGRYRGEFPRLRVVDASGVRGSGHARNEGVRAARGDSRNYGRHNVLLYKMYRPRGMPRASSRSGVRRWLVLARTAPRLLRADQRLRWLRDLAWRWDRIEGCVRFRVLAL